MKRVKKTKQEPSPIEETVSAWKKVAQAARPLLKPRILLTTVAIIIILLILYGAFLLHATITQDLLITIDQPAAVVRAYGDEHVPITFTIKTNNYLFCEASCTLSIVDIATGENILKQEELLRNANLTITVETTTPQGEGKRFYSLIASCRNVERFTCARTEGDVLASALAIIEYSLTPDEITARDNMITEADELFTVLTQGDRALQETETLVDALLTFSDTDGLDNLEIRLAQEQKNWRTLTNQEQKLRTAISNYQIIEILNAEAAADRIEVLLAEMKEYYALQHELVRKLEQDRDAYASATWRGAAYWHESELLGDYEEDLGNLITEVQERPAARILSRMTKLILLENDATRLKEKISKKLLQDLNLVEHALKDELSARNQTMGPLNTEADIEGIMTAFVTRCGELITLTPINKNETLHICANNIAEHANPLPSGTLRMLDEPTLNIIVDERAPLELPELICCSFGECAACCKGCQTPILFLHGHSMNERNAPEYSLGAFGQISQALQERDAIIDAGSISLYSRTVPFPVGAWGGTGRIGVHGTYYYDTYLSGKSYVLSIEKSENIDTYAIRLQDLIDTLRARTGSEKVIIVTHSMGGIVARRYLQVFGSEKVEQLIMVAPPNHGIEAQTAKFCPLFGADRECEDLKQGSPFLLRLNDPSFQPTAAMMVIYGDGCISSDQPSDGVVTVASARLDGIPEEVITGTCSGLETLHTELLHPTHYPEVIDILLRELE